MKGRSRKHEANDKVSGGHPSRPIRKKRGRSKQIEKEKVKVVAQKPTIDDIKFNKKVMSNLEKSGAINYLLAEMFAQLSIYANQHHRKRLLIQSDFKSCIKSEKNKSDNDYSNVQERNKIKHLIASRIVYEYLIDHKLNLTTDALQNETKNDKAFSSKTPASFSPLQLGEYDVDENNSQKSETIKKIILANKRTELTKKPPVRRRKDDDEILFGVQQQKTGQLKRKGSLNSDFSLASINSSLNKQEPVFETDSDSNPSYVQDEEEEDEYDGYEQDEDKLEQNNEESNSPLDVEPNTPQSKLKSSLPPPSTTSPKKQNSPSIRPAPPLKTDTLTKLENSNELSSDNEKLPDDSTSDFEITSSDVMKNVKIKWPTTPTRAKNEISTMDLSLNSGDPNLIDIPNMYPTAKSTSSQAIEEIPELSQNVDSKEDSLNESSGSEHELQAEDEYNSDKNNQ